MNKKGFMFVETIVTLTVLMALLITLYTVFINLLQKERTTAEYDSYGDKYALFYYKESLGESNIEARKDKKYYHFLYGLDVLHQTDASKRNCNFAIMSCNNLSNKISDLKTLTTIGNCTGVSDDFEKFKDNIASCPTNAEVVILGEFYNGKTYSYAHIYYPNIPIGEGS